MAPTSLLKMGEAPRKYWGYGTPGGGCHADRLPGGHGNRLMLSGWLADRPTCCRCPQPTVARWQEGRCGYCGPDRIDAGCPGNLKRLPVSVSLSPSTFNTDRSWSMKLPTYR